MCFNFFLVFFEILLNKSLLYIKINYFNPFLDTQQGQEHASVSLMIMLF